MIDRLSIKKSSYTVQLGQKSVVFHERLRSEVPNHTTIFNLVEVVLKNIYLHATNTTQRVL